MRIILILILMSTYANANMCSTSDLTFWNNANQGRGWFWKEQPCVSDNVTDNKSTEEDYKFIAEKTKIPWDIIDKLDPDEIAQKIEPETRKIAITYPTDENLSEYRRLTVWMTSKATKYANADQRIRTFDPSLMPDSVNAKTSSWAEQIIINQRFAMIDDYMAKYSDSAALIVITRPNCIFCEKQIPILNSLNNKYNWQYFIKDISETPGDAIKLNIDMTPDIFLILKKNDGSSKHLRIATGLTTLDDLTNAILRGLLYLGENINEKAIY